MQVLSLIPFDETYREKLRLLTGERCQLVFGTSSDSREDYIEKLPKCAYCGEPIQDDYCYEINGEVICEDCLNDNFRVSTESLID